MLNFVRRYLKARSRNVLWVLGFEAIALSQYVYSYDYIFGTRRELGWKLIVIGAPLWLLYDIYSFWSEGE